MWAAYSNECKHLSAQRDPNISEMVKEIHNITRRSLLPEFYSSVLPGGGDNVKLFQQQLGYPYCIIAR